MTQHIQYETVLSAERKVKRYIKKRNDNKKGEIKLWHQHELNFILMEGKA